MEDGWKSIKTAPKDGRLMQVRSRAWGKPDGRLITSLAIWYVDGWAGPDFYTPDADCRLVYAAEWRPLPAPPVTTET